jgi:hypothetical protein
MSVQIDNRGRLVFGAKPIARHSLGDEKHWRRVYNPRVQQELGLFMFGGQLAGWTGIMAARMEAKLTASLSATPAPQREAAASKTGAA